MTSRPTRPSAEPGALRRLALASLLLACTWTAAPTWAFNLNSNQPIHVTADHARLDDRQGTATYTGDVVVTQEGSKLTGDKVVLYRDKQGVDRIESFGAPAHYHEPATPPNQPATDAQAKTITYSRDKHLITLKTDAVVEQDGNVFKGDLIHYDTNTRVVTAQGNGDGNNANSGRVQMIIQPKKAQPNTQPAAPRDKQ